MDTSYITRRARIAIVVGAAVALMWAGLPASGNPYTTFAYGPPYGGSVSVPEPGGSTTHACLQPEGTGTATATTGAEDPSENGAASVTASAGSDGCSSQFGAGGTQGVTVEVPPMVGFSVRVGYTVADVSGSATMTSGGYAVSSAALTAYANGPDGREATVGLDGWAAACVPASELSCTRSFSAEPGSYQTSGARYLPYTCIGCDTRTPLACEKGCTVTVQLDAYVHLVGDEHQPVTGSASVVADVTIDWIEIDALCTADGVPCLAVPPKTV